MPIANDGRRIIIIIIIIIGNLLEFILIQLI